MARFYHRLCHLCPPPSYRLRDSYRFLNTHHLRYNDNSCGSAPGQSSLSLFNEPVEDTNFCDRLLF